MSLGTRPTITHYEELGVAPNATSKEIRAALRKLSSLIHPDRCTDPTLRRLAEIQSKRINSMRGVLLDSASRSIYDESLRHVDQKYQCLVRIPNPAPPARIPAHNWPWALALVVGISGVLFLGRQVTGLRPDTSGLKGQAISNSLPLTQEPTSPLLQRVPLRISTKQNEFERQGSPVRELPVPEFIAPPITIASSRETSDAPAPEVAIVETAKPANAPLHGRWLYVRPRNAALSGGSYAPDFVELDINETAGVLQARYKARYLVADRAISPDVSFAFEGQSTNSGRLAWQGSGGSSGHLSLKLLSEDRLEVLWTADNMGTELGLISGKSTLVRRAD